MSVVFQHLDGKETCRIVVVGLGIEADEFFHTLNTLLYQHAVIYVYVAEGGLPSFIDFDYLVKQCIDSFACAPYGGYYWYSEQYAQLVDVEAVAACSKLVIHVERHDYWHIHVDELGGEVKVALQVRGIYHVDYHVGHLLDYVSAYIQFFGCICSEAVGAGQVGDVEVIALEIQMSFLGINGHTRVVAYTLVSIPCNVEQACLAAVGIAHKCHADGSAALLSHAVQVNTVVGSDAALCMLLLLPFTGLCFGHHLHHVGLGPTQAHLIVEQTIFHGVHKRSIEHHFHRGALYEPHLNDAFAKSAVTVNLHYHAALARI